jgi:hypothetical protein
MKILTCNIDKLDKTSFHFNKNDFTLQEVNYKIVKDVLVCTDIETKKQVRFTKNELLKVISEASDVYMFRKYFLNKCNLTFNRSQRVKLKDRIRNTISDNTVSAIEAFLSLTFQRKDKNIYRVKQTA